MTDIDQLFDATRHATLRGADSISFEWWFRTARLAFDAQDWPTALDRVARLGDLVQHDDAGRTAILGLALTACIHGNVPGRVETALAQWNSAPESNLDLLKSVVELASQQECRASEITLDLVSKRLPRWSPIWAAQGERYDRLGKWSQSFPAWQKAEPGLGSVATMRAGVAAMHAGDSKSGRDLLRQATPDAQNFAWITTGWVASHRFFDRLRAYDALDDVMAAELRAEPGAGRPPLSVLQDTLRTVLQLIPPVLSNDEYERLAELVRKAFDPLEAAAAMKRLDARVQANEAQPEGDEAKAADVILARLEGRLEDTASETNADVEMMNRAAAGSLNALDLEPTLALPPHQWGPLHAVWLCLEGPEMASDLETPFLTWIALARRPEHGWLPMAEHFMSRGLFFAGMAVLQRAMREGENTPEDAFERLLEHAISHATETANEKDMQWWLVQASGR